MKKLKSALLMLTLLVVSLAGCKKEEEVNTSMSVKVNGTLKQAIGETKVFALIYTSEKMLQVSGDLGNNQAISLSIENYTGVGEYNVATNDVIATYVSDINGGINGSHLGSTGSIKITTATDQIIKGTFQFVDEDSSPIITASEGTFECKIKSM